MYYQVSILIESKLGLEELKKRLNETLVDGDESHFIKTPEGYVVEDLGYSVDAVDAVTLLTEVN